MKHCFIINSQAGKGKLAPKLNETVRETCDKRGVRYDVFMPNSVGDSSDYIKRMVARREAGEELSFFACGGDGTLCETVNGVMSLDTRDGISVGVLPIGTGNDFVRNFTPKEAFLDLEAQLDSESYDVDLIRCNDLYAINMINVGFDSEVVAKKEELGHKVPSKLAYICGLAICLIRKPGVKMEISCGGGEYEKKSLLLTTFANGSFCGGGFYSNPRASLSDGYLDMLQVNDVSRTRFLSVVGSYKKGTHLREKFNKILRCVKEESVHIILDKTMNVSIDGELKRLAELHLSVEKNALRFRVPKGVSPLSPLHRSKMAAVEMG